MDTVVTRQQIIDFVNAQPDERPVDMRECINSEPFCGCVMIHYGREVLKLFSSKDFFGCGVAQWIVEDGLAPYIHIENYESIGDILNISFDFEGNYGQIKARLLQKN